MTDAYIAYAVEAQAIILALRGAFLIAFAAAVFFAWCYRARGKLLAQYRQKYEALYERNSELKDGIALAQKEARRMDRLFRKTSECLTERNRELDALRGPKKPLRRVA